MLVSGRVQGVFYRAETDQTAHKLEIHGWVRNLPDGRVEAVFEGPQDAVEAMIDWCHQGSRAARVSNVKVEYAQPEGIEGFVIQ